MDEREIEKRTDAILAQRWEPTAADLFGAALFDQVCEWLGENVEPERVFDSEILGNWARDNGFVSVDVPESGPGREL